MIELVAASQPGQNGTSRLMPEQSSKNKTARTEQHQLNYHRYQYQIT
jgi:hypothetical protein